MYKLLCAWDIPEGLHHMVVRRHGVWKGLGHGDTNSCGYIGRQNHDWVFRFGFEMGLVAF